MEPTIKLKSWQCRPSQGQSASWKARSAIEPQELTQEQRKHQLPTPTGEEEQDFTFVEEEEEVQIMGVLQALEPTQAPHEDWR